MSVTLQQNSMLTHPILRGNQFVLLFFLVLASIKLLLVYIYGPMHFDDTGGYLTFANEILRGDNWMHSPSWISTYRMLGYPLLIAGSKWISPAHFEYILILGQTFTSLIAAYMLFRLSLIMTRSYLLASLVPIGYLSANMTWDLSILTDGFYNSLFSIIACGIVLNALKRKTVSLSTTFTLGILASISVVLRESAIYFCAFLTLIHFIGLAYQQGKSLQKTLSVLVFLGPILGTYFGYQLWNDYRTGHPFLTTGMSTALMQPLVKVGQYGVNLFQEDTCFDRVARSVVQKNEWSEVGIINKKLKTQCDYSNHAIAQATKSKYLSSLIHHPVAYFQYAVVNVPKVAILTWNPIEFFWRNEAMYHDLPKQTPGKKLKSFRHNFSPFDLGSFVLAFLSRLLSVLLFFVFCLGTPFSIVQSLRHKQPLTCEKALQLGLWTTCFGVMTMYWLVHWEHRYTVSLSGLILTLALFDTKHLLMKLKFIGPFLPFGTPATPKELA